MRIGELSTVSGVAVATLKYYLREGLLHPGVATAVNQAEYDDSHVRRLRLVRVLLQLGHLSIDEVRTVVAAVDDESLSIHRAFGVAQDAMVTARDRNHPRYAAALADVDDLVSRHGLRVRPDAAVRLMLADAVMTFEQLGLDSLLGQPRLSAFDDLLPTIRDLADAQVASVPVDVTRTEQMEFSVVGTIAFEVAYAALRRLALEHASAVRFEPRRTPRRKD